MEEEEEKKPQMVLKTARIQRNLLVCYLRNRPTNAFDENGHTHIQALEKSENQPR